MFTSNFARLKTLTSGLKPIAICQGPPWWFKGPKDLRLAPTREMLNTALAATEENGPAIRAEFDRKFEEMLSQLDPKKIYEELGDNAVLLCWEGANVRCHRRAVAEWLEKSLGIVITEFGFERDKVLAYKDAPPKKKSSPKKPKEPTPRQSTLDFPQSE